MNFLLALEGIWFVFPVAWEPIYFFFALALFNFLCRSLILQRGLGGERQKPLIRLLFSVTQHSLLLAPPHTPRSHVIVCQRRGLCFFFNVNLKRGG